jgi:hypothetical protein
MARSSPGRSILDQSGGSGGCALVHASHVGERLPDGLEPEGTGEGDCLGQDTCDQYYACGELCFADHC